MRAEFADFNVDGLRKFHQSQKNHFQNPLVHDKREMDFTQPVQNTDLASDFLNWDMNPAPQPQTTPPVITEEFTNFDFGSAKKQPSEATEDFFNLGLAHPQPQTSDAPQKTNFWDAFSSQTEEPLQTTLDQKQSSTPALPEKPSPQPSTQDLLLQLSLDPNEPAQEAPKGPEPQPSPAPAAQQPSNGPASFLDIELV